MPLVTINNEELFLIGDPHLGKEFINGVSLDRRGQREEYQFATFENELHSPQRNPAIRTVICMGDLFDKFRVSNNVLAQTYHYIAEAAQAFPKVSYVFLMGNHDITRNTELVSSFDILSMMFKKHGNVRFIKENTWFRSDGLMNNIYLLCPYSAFDNSVTAFEKTKDYVDIKSGIIVNTLECSAAFGHWDVESFGGEGHNLIPYKQFAKITKEVYTGHVHTPEIFMVDEEGNRSVKATHCKITVVGSMLPYSHGEDPTEQYYVTRTLEQYLEAIEKEPSPFSDKALRLLLKPGEELPPDVVAMQLTYKYVDAKQQEEVEVTLESFSFETIFKEVMLENGVTEALSNQTWARYKELNTDDTEA